MITKLPDTTQNTFYKSIENLGKQHRHQEVLAFDKETERLPAKDLFTPGAQPHIVIIYPFVAIIRTCRPQPLDLGVAGQTASVT